MEGVERLLQLFGLTEKWEKGLGYRAKKAHPLAVLSSISLPIFTLSHDLYLHIFSWLSRPEIFDLSSTSCFAFFLFSDPQTLKSPTLVLKYWGCERSPYPITIELTRRSFGLEALGELISGAKRGRYLNCRELRLGTNFLGYEGFERLARVMRQGFFVRLKLLDIGNNNLRGDWGTQLFGGVMGKAHTLPSLEYLDVSNNEIGCVSSWVLRRAFAKSHSLQVLICRGCRLSAAGLHQLAKALISCRSMRLRVLDLSSLRMTTSGFLTTAKFALLEGFPRLHPFLASSKPILKKSGAFSELKELNIIGLFKSTDTFLVFLAAASHSFRKVEVLRVDKAGHGNELAETLHRDYMPRLRVLEIKERLSDKQVEGLAVAFRRPSCCSSLETLVISCSLFGSKRRLLVSIRPGLQILDGS